MLRRLREDRPEIEVRQREIGVPGGLVALREGELDVLLGDAAAAPDGVAVEPLRQEMVQVMLAADHPCAAQPTVPVAALADEVWLLPPDDVAPEWNQSSSGTASRPVSGRAATRERRGPAAAAELAVERRSRGADQRLAHRAGRGGVPAAGRPGDPVPVVGDVGGAASEPVEALLAAARAVGRERLGGPAETAARWCPTTRMCRGHEAPRATRGPRADPQ